MCRSRRGGAGRERGGRGEAEMVRGEMWCSVVWCGVGRRGGALDQI